MTNENKNIHDLVSESDEDTSELEILPDTIAADPDFDYESESDAATHAFESLNKKTDDASVVALQAELRERDETVNSLEYDVEQLRARWTGLETELKAREELTTNVTTELTQTHQKLTQAHERLKKREQTIASLESTVREREERLGDANRSIAQLHLDAGATQSEIAELNTRHAGAMDRIDSLMGELNSEKAERLRTLAAERALGAAFRELDERQTEARSQIESLNQYIEGRKNHWERQEAELRSKAGLLKEQRKKIGLFTRDIKRDTKRLRKEQAARQNLQTQNEILQKDNAQLNGDVVELKSLMADLDESLRNAQQEAGTLSARLDDTSRALEEEQADRSNLAAELRTRQDEMNALQKHTAALQNETTQLRQDNSRLEEAASRQEEAISHKQAEIESLAAQLSDASKEFETVRSDWQTLVTQHAALEEQAGRLNSEVQTLTAAAAYKASLKKENSELSGLAASNEATIKELKSQLSKTEAYADTLRMKLQKQMADSESLSSGQQSVEASLETALARIGKLTVQLEAEQTANAELTEENREQQRKLEEELRTIRFELDAAQETIAENQTINEQLTSDLIENTGFRRALESQLVESDEDRQKEIKALNRQLVQLKKEVETYERKVTNKDAAINALLTELANKPHAATTEKEPDNVVHRLTNKKLRGADEKPAPEKDRVTRLLIGNIDGQELRFPLFKDKLTIGRTAHNDIQIKAQFISRRHAVVVTDDDCTRIVDWGSKNGIYVNGVRVTEKVLKNGDQVTVGTARFKFEERQKR